MKKLKRGVFILAFCIALFPPIWAVLAPYVGVTTGAVALICAGLYVTNGNKASDAVKISFGFLMGDFWAAFALFIMNYLPFNKDINLFITLYFRWTWSDNFSIVRKVGFLSSTALWMGNWSYYTCTSRIWKVRNTASSDRCSYACWSMVCWCYCKQNADKNRKFI